MNINKADKYIKNTLIDIITIGTRDESPRPHYTDGEPAYSKFITQQVFNFDISKGEFPITTLRNGSLKMAFQEMKTIFIDQSNKDEDFKKNGISWWTPWMNEHGDLGTAYSYNLESNPVNIETSKNQVVELLKNLENDKFSRRHMLSFFNWPEQDKKQLVECAFQSLFSVRVLNGVNIIDQTLIQRSSDFLVAGMINCSQYVMLGMIICNHLEYRTKEEWKLGNFTWFVQNCHLYERHIEGAEEVLSKDPTGLQPKIELICEPKDFFHHTWKDFRVIGLEGIKPLSKKLEIAL